jgi:DNA repair photolyase
MKAPIYEPSGKAKEYGDLAINIYTGCTHGCYYCFAPNVLHKIRADFSTDVKPRQGIVEEVKKQLEKEKITDKMIHLCFTCDPYPTLVDTTATREIIKLLKDYGNHVQILTKGGQIAQRDFDLLDSNDRFGVTITPTGYEDVYGHPDEPFAADNVSRYWNAMCASNIGIKAWISFEPVLCADAVLAELEIIHSEFDIKIGKLNYHPSPINWSEFGHAAEEICKRRGLTYYIKESLRNEMNRNPQEVNHE